jgi:RHS repeat-associated protein
MKSLPGHIAEYTKFNKVSFLNDFTDSTENRKLFITYGPDEQRTKSLYTVNDETVKSKIFALGNYEKEIDSLGNIRELYYISASNGLIAILQRTNNQDSIFYIHTDHLGSFDAVTTSDGAVRERYNFDPWGRRRNTYDWSYTNISETFLFDRGFTGHEHLDKFGLINMNGRVYDPLIAMFLSPDNNVQAPDFTQNYNRYSYCLNNPLVYTDPSGEIFWLIPIGIGALIGTYTGGVIANEGKYNPTKWDYSSGKTWGYMLGGAVVGGVSGYAGWAIAGSGIPMANTAAIAGASFTNSVGTYMYTSGQTPISMSFGVASYDFTNSTFGYLGKKGNSALENIGFGFGALANLSDMVSLLRGGGQNIKVNSATTKDGHEWWGHSSITDENGNTLVSVGPDSQVQKAASLSETWQNSIKGADVNWNTYLGAKGTWSAELNNVSTTAISKYASGISRWDLLLNSCVGHTTRALWSAGIPTIYALHPHILNLQLLIRQLGIYSSPYLYQIP